MLEKKSKQRWEGLYSRSGFTTQSKQIGWGLVRVYLVYLAERTCVNVESKQTRPKRKRARSQGETEFEGRLNQNDRPRR